MVYGEGGVDTDVHHAFQIQFIAFMLFSKKEDQRKKYWSLRICILYELSRFY